MNAPSLSGFLDVTGANYQLFDLGTHLKQLPRSTLALLDNGSKYPYPYLGFAWVATFIWDAEHPEQNNLWFLKLPLDEQGCLVPAVHSDLVRRLYTALQTNDDNERRRLLTDHPYQFQPDSSKMAALHAKATQLLSLPASPYFEPAAEFYLLQNEQTDWKTLGIQGLADLAERCLHTHEQEFSRALSVVGDEPFIALAGQLQHVETSPAITRAAITSAQRRDTAHTIQSALRATSQTAEPEQVEGFILNLIDTGKLDLETLLIIFTNYPALFSNLNLAGQLMTELSIHTDETGFNRVITNLAMQQGMEGIVMKIFSSDALNETLANALSRLIQSARK
ncbi:DUF3549 family protein [Reinekea marinisedimentorum]|uniref:Uncharacterized protein DUF3549 n=1 Tax=Reinekea marinisedimentorum TaxID=230495 RepID=A0A4R3I5C2_9GAMM|nr:DUF3549 family protein [Reinekea marinisedimentorum]TCS40143.1 uncharacterized protein DUF3549 [Reinekea marinisedimentorum]